MKQCESCWFYSSQYDELRRLWDDTNDEVKNHYCQMYENPIDVDIIHDKVKCNYHVDEPK